MLPPYDHPWKTTLRHLRNHFAIRCAQEWRLYDGFSVEIPTWFAGSEQIWFTYGYTCSIERWTATFTDHWIVIEENGQQQFIEYADIAAVDLPNLKTGPVCAFQCAGKPIEYTTTTLALYTGARVIVRGAVHNKRRDAYLWHVLTKTKYDRDRNTPLA